MVFLNFLPYYKTSVALRMRKIFYSSVIILTYNSLTTNTLRYVKIKVQTFNNPLPKMSFISCKLI